ncbi:hypothetical protein SAMN04488541_101765 [Thermoflexibacter ruber]|uniref:Uncharacterized protein n=1 Tax=Thermoflexibacter ruber TaxID=1003 RepID=A0A1I2GA27_9BACT|nr:hypothetical protein SAMN04488541_101765 [Thermoflexibacter ruber]
MLLGNKSKGFKFLTKNNHYTPVFKRKDIKKPVKVLSCGEKIQ